MIEDCIICPGYRNAQGYGRKQVKGVKYQAHRVAYAKANGLDVSTLVGVVMHKCDNPGCINPKHLTLGTHSDNMQDMVQKGRSMRGEKHRSAVLTLEQAKEIRARHVPNCRVNGSSALAREYGVSHTTICQTVRNKRWTESPSSQLCENQGIAS